MGEGDSIRRGLGKWGQAGVPRKGWDEDGYYDLGFDDRTTCEMCETAEIRFVHVMVHPAWPDALRCGCVCAEHMGARYARANEKIMRSTARRKDRWLERSGWTRSKNGNAIIKADGHVMIVAARRGGFGVGIKEAGPGEFTWGRKTYASEDEARMGCFDALEYVLKNGE